eukprot:TRINITY_DN24625_c0_g1_i1.p1 TRINITY_DN24625_c0_g1~~TRINITY_DN24625_c0_g1_i1.p1  ORF type:complete len:539 (-),score=64.97 TRINITY_DN24625_c0_g1_i1:22-1638(-)
MPLLPPGFSDPREYIFALAKFLQEHRYVYDLRLVEFLVEDHWSAIPSGLREDLIAVDAAHLRNYPPPTVAGGPLGVFLEAASALAIPKRLPATEKGTTVIAADPLLRLNMSPKKLHEVQTLTTVVDDLCSRRGVRDIVDIGAGEGYLSASLQFVHGYNVVAIDGSESNTAGATKRSEAITQGLQQRTQCADRARPATASQLQRSTEGGELPDFTQLFDDDLETPVPRADRCDSNLGVAEPPDDKPARQKNRYAQRPTKEATRPAKKAACALQGICHIACFLPAATTLADLQGHINKPDFGQPPGACLCSLHACGELTVTMLRLWLGNPEFQLLAAVGCCYYKMGGEDDTGPFPLSHHLRNTVNFNCGKGGLKLACEALTTWCEKSDDEYQFMLMHTFYRCAFQLLLKRLFEVEYPQLFVKGFIRKDACGSFPDFCARAFPRLRNKTQPAKVYTLPPVHELEVFWRSLDRIAPDRLLRFLFLRAVISTLLEGLVAMDRYLFLVENCQPGWQVDLVALFDETISPRNLCILAAKDSLPLQ